MKNKALLLAFAISFLTLGNTSSIADDDDNDTNLSDFDLSDVGIIPAGFPRFLHEVEGVVRDRGDRVSVRAWHDDDDASIHFDPLSSIDSIDIDDTLFYLRADIFDGNVLNGISGDATGKVIIWGKTDEGGYYNDDYYANWGYHFNTREKLFEADITDGAISYTSSEDGDVSISSEHDEVAYLIGFNTDISFCHEVIFEFCTRGESVYIKLDDGEGLFGRFDDALAVTTVPIPTTVWLFGSGLLGMVSFARRRKV